MTKKIIVPTDFSDNAYSAAQYACSLAVKNNYAIHLFHCYSTKSALFDDELENNETNAQLLKADLLIVEWKNKLLQEFSSLEIDTECVRGLLPEVLPAIAVEPNYSLIVMGSTGQGKGKSIAWGSNASHISTKAKIPVLAIPINYKSIAVDKIAILTNFKSDELETLKEFYSKVATIDCIDLIHVYGNGDNVSKIEEQMDSWSFMVKGLNGVENVNTILKQTVNTDENLDTIPEVIIAILKEKQYDLILVTKTRKTFFERVFKTSISKEIALKLEIPSFFDNN